MKAGLQPGIQAATVGPSSFDVDATGRVFLADSLQDRVALFAGGRLVRQTRIALTPKAEIATSSRAVAFISEVVAGTANVRVLGKDGLDGRPESIGPALSAHLRASASGPVVNLEPLDAWLALGRDGSPHSAPAVGMPMSADERFVRVGTDHFVRIGLVRGGSMVSAVELRSTVRFGDVAVAEPTGPSGAVVVVRTWQSGSSPVDQYEVITLMHGALSGAFAVSSGSFAGTLPQARFRVGKDGALYGMTSTSSSMSIVRFELGRTR
jgi:hypothetical protein